MSVKSYVIMYMKMNVLNFASFSNVIYCINI